MVKNTIRSNFHGIICSDYWISISLQAGGALFRTKIFHFSHSIGNSCWWWHPWWDVCELTSLGISWPSKHSMQVQLLKLSICVLNKKKSELTMWGGIIIASISSYPLSTSKLLFSCPCKGQDLHNAKWSCGSGLSDTRQTYYKVAPAHGVVADGKRRRIFSSSFFPTDTAPYPSSRDGWRFVGFTQSEKTLYTDSRDGCKFVGSGPEQTNFVSTYSRDGWQVCWLCPESQETLHWRTI